MNDTVTILGRVGNDPIRSETTGGVAVVNFRVASPQRRYDAKTQAWIETGTNWYTVSAFRQLAEHAKASLHSGDGVIVTGRLKVREWENSSGRKGTSVDVEADAIGHDLRWGASAYVKASRPAQVQAAFPADHPPQDGDDVDVSGVDTLTGEVQPAMALSGSGWGDDA
jgi:single-strand DNA-binding protein